MSTPTPPTPSKTNWLLRLIVGSVLGLLMTLISLYVAWGVGSHTLDDGRFTKLHIQRIGHCLESFRTEYKRYPDSLLELKHYLAKSPKQKVTEIDYVKEYVNDVVINKDGQVKEGRRGDITYERGDDSYRLISLGYDGRPGGIGVAADITSDNLDVNAKPTMSDVIFLSERGSAFLTVSILSGLILFIIVMVPKKDSGVLLHDVAASFFALIFVTFLLISVLSSGH